MFMDVKLDIRERKLEFSHLKSWTRYFVRVEAVKCFPCYMKISFFKSHTDENTDLIVRINIPGLTVQMATSRTRAHSYGLFWKNNRKRCCAYFALPSQLLCERHLHWMKKSIRNLELYRQEILQLRRASRTPIHEIRQDVQPDPANNDLGIYQNLDITQNMADVHDILGPLPKVPDQSEVNLSRRVSAISGIYEEIFDPTRPSGFLMNGPRMSRASVASGIYEEMKLTDIKEQMERSTEELTENDDMAPPLPPRPRTHTNEFELQRSFSTPESDYMKKKKHWQLFESMFGRRRTNSGTAAISSSTSDIKPPKKECLLIKPPKASAANEKVVYREKVAHLRLSENKRNSFSSPDLSILKLDGSNANNGMIADNLSDEGSCSSEFFVKEEVDYIEEDCFVSSEFLSVSKCSSIEESLANLLIAEENIESKFAGAMNVSEQIFPDFNPACNTSTINLVGLDFNLTKCNTTAAPLDTNPVGYCEMGPAGTGFNRQKLQNVEFREKEQNESQHTESIYINMESKVANQDETSRSSSTSSGVSSMNSNRSSDCSSGKHRNSVDDKIPSYYPNEDFRTSKKNESSPVSKTSPRSREGYPTKMNEKRLENHYVSSPKPVHRRGFTQNTATMPRLSKSAQKPASSKAKIYNRSISSERCDTSHPMIVNDVPTKNSENSPPEMTPKSYRKYATIAHSSSSSSATKYQEKNLAKKTADQVAIGNTKRFASLPRFAKIDLSPLRLKINSVLQRHNPENL